MPIYEYRCKECGKTHEIEHGFNAERPTSCPSCGGHLARVFHPVGVVFKGAGFHKNDYTSSGLRKDPSREASGAASEPKTDGKAADAKPAVKPETKTPDSSPTAKSGDAKPPSGPSKT